MPTCNKLLEKFCKEYPETIRKGTQTEAIVQLRTGIFTVDLLTGGIPMGKFTVLWGAKSSGKTTLSYKIIDSFMKATQNKYSCLYADFEKGFNKVWAEKFIDNMDKLIWVEPLYGEQGVDVIYDFAQADDMGLIVIDSAAMIFSISEADSPAEDNYVGPSARLIRKLCNKLLVAMTQAKQDGRPLTVIIINQVRANIGGQKFAAKTRMPGGKVLDHITSLTLKLYQKNYKTEDGVPKKSVHTFSIDKNRLGLPKMNGEFTIDLIRGRVDDIKSILEYAKRYDMLQKLKEGYSLLGEVRPRLKDIKSLMEDRDFKDMVVDAIIEQYQKEIRNDSQV